MSLPNATSDSQQVDRLTEEAASLERSAPAKMMKIAEQAYQLATSAEYNRGIVESMILLGRAQLRLGNLSEANKLLSQVLERGPLDELLEARIYNALGTVHYYLKIFDKTFDYFQRGLALATSIRDLDLQARLLNNIGEVYREHQDFPTALKYLRESQEIRMRLPIWNSQAVVVANLSFAYLQQGDLEQAELHAQEAFHLAQEHNDRLIQGTCLRYRGTIARKRGQREQALGFLRASLEIYESTKERLHTVQVLLEFHHLHFTEGDSEASIRYLQEALSIAEEADSLSVRAEIYTELSKVYESLGDLKSALDYLKKRVNAVETMEHDAREQRLRAFGVQKAADEYLREKEAYRALSQQLDEKTRELAMLSSRDGLTGVANRRYFDEFLAQAWATALRQKLRLSVLMIDVDYFKAYNDNYGHLSGDEVIKQVAWAIQRSVKRSNDLVARFGGDEFIVLLSDTDTPGALHVAERVRQEVANCCMLHGHSPADLVTLSIGVCSMLPSTDNSSGDLLAGGDAALYRAKQAGRDQIQV